MGDTPTASEELPMAEKLALQRLRQGCGCRCCDHSEGSDCACACHATGECADRSPVKTFVEARVPHEPPAELHTASATELLDSVESWLTGFHSSVNGRGWNNQPAIPGDLMEAIAHHLKREAHEARPAPPLDCPRCAEMQRAVTQMARENRSLEKRINQLSAPPAAHAAPTE